jgi:hypothetical protein
VATLCRFKSGLWYQTSNLLFSGFCCFWNTVKLILAGPEPVPGSGIQAIHGLHSADNARNPLKYNLNYLTERSVPKSASGADADMITVDYIQDE